MAWEWNDCSEENRAVIIICLMDNRADSCRGRPSIHSIP